jgi:hypothetical protein
MNSKELSSRMNLTYDCGYEYIQTKDFTRLPVNPKNGAVFRSRGELYRWLIANTEYVTRNSHLLTTVYLKDKDLEKRIEAEEENEKIARREMGQTQGYTMYNNPAPSNHSSYNSNVPGGMGRGFTGYNGHFPGGHRTYLDELKSRRNTSGVNVSIMKLFSFVPLKHAVALLRDWV